MVGLRETKPNSSSNQPHPAFCHLQCACVVQPAGRGLATSVRVPLPYSFFPEGLAWIVSHLCSTHSVIGSNHMRIIPISHLLEKAFTNGQLQDVSLGEGKDLHGIPWSQYCLVSSVVVSCLTFYQSTSVHFSPVISYILTVGYCLCLYTLFYGLSLSYVWYTTTTEWLMVED